MKENKSQRTEDYKQAALDYPRKLSEGDLYYQYVKPFGGDENKSYSADLFHSFANILQILNLPIRSKILDVACGPGWLSEYLARSGYEVTGIDISRDLIRIAKERIDTIKYGPYKNLPIKADFIVSDPEVQIIGNKIYNTAIFFDSLHHFCNPQSALEHVFEALKPGGKLLIREGIKPEKGSNEDKKLLDEMDKYGTLEKPFRHNELKKLLADVGFNDIEAYEFINISVKRHGNSVYPAIKDIPIPQTNTILCRKPGKYLRDSSYPGKLMAHIENIGTSPPKKAVAGELIEVTLRIRNIGDTLWLYHPAGSGGFVCIGTKLLDNKRNFITDSINRSTFQSNVHPGDSVIVKHQFKIPNVHGPHWIKIDLVDELIMWFEENGSNPFEWPIYILK